MILANMRDEPFYIEDVINFLFMRDEALFIDKIYHKEDYLKIAETLILLFQDVEKIPKEDIYNIAKQIIQNLYTLHYEDEYVYYKDKELHNGTSPAKQIKRDINKIQPYEDLLKKLYSDYIYTFNGNDTLINAPEDVKEYFTLLNRLKDNLTKKGTIENNYYYKPEKPEKIKFMKLFQELKEHYIIKFNDDILKALNSQI